MICLILQALMGYLGHIEDIKSAEFGFVAISGRSNYIFTGLKVRALHLFSAREGHS